MTPAHGTAQRYWHGCRCVPCRVALATYRAQRALERAHGQTRRVSALLAWRVVRDLKREGWTLGQIGVALGRRWPRLTLGARWVRRQTWEKLQQLRARHE